MFDFMFRLSRKSRIVNRIMSSIYSCNIPFCLKLGKEVVFNHKALGCVIHPNTVIEDKVHIEHHVCLGQRTGNDLSAPIIRKNCVIGAYAIILGGVEIGEGSIIGAGSIVMEDVPPHSIFYNSREKIIAPNNKNIGSY